MSPRRINGLLYSVAAALIIAAAATLAASFAPLEQLATPRSDKPPTSTVPLSQVDDAERAALASLDSAFSRHLRGKPAPADTRPAMQAPPPQPAAPAITLVGTIGNSALLRVGDGNVVARSVGQKMNDAEVIQVRPNEAQLKIGGKVVTIRKAGASQ